MSCGLTLDSTDRQPPSMLGERERQMWRAVERRRKLACDWYGCHRERSQPCLRKTGLSILPPFKQTKGHLCTLLLQALTSASLSKITPHIGEGPQLNCSALIFSCICHYFCIVASLPQEWKAIFSINAFCLSPFASHLLFNRVLLRVAGALLNSIPLLLRHKFGGFH